jgi:hypothetical protein
MPGFAGLQTNLLTWIIVAGLTGCWLISVRLVPGWEQQGWRALLQSAFGFVWMGFGLDIVVRFLMLSYNAVEWGDYSLRLVALPVDTVNAALAYCWVFWLLVSASYAIAARRRTAGPLALVGGFNVELAYAAAPPMAVMCCVLFYVIDTPGRVPMTLLTPLAAVANLYIIPAAVVWWDHLRRPGPWWRVGGVHLLVLLPALVNAWRTPYRESLAPIFFVPLLAAAFAGRRPQLRKLLPAAVICFLVVSSLVSAYRRIKWDNTRPEEVASEVRSAGVMGWLMGDFGERMSRFHSFDSMLLTVHLIPNALPYSGRSVLVAPFLRGLVPRFIYGDKVVVYAGQRFSTEIWAFDSPSVRENSTAAIAPSMPGDLYDSGGVMDVVLGALIWGALIGLVDGWKAHVPAFCAAALTALIATHCAMSIERDFDHEVAGLIQILLVVVVVSGVIALARRRNTNLSSEFDSSLEFKPRGLDPSLERS